MLLPAGIASAQQFSWHAYWEVARGRSHEVVAAGIPHAEYQQHLILLRMN